MITASLNLGVSKAPQRITKMTEQVELNNWEKERLVEDKGVKDLFVTQSWEVRKYMCPNYCTRALSGKEGCVFVSGMVGGNGGSSEKAA